MAMKASSLLLAGIAITMTSVGPANAEDKKKPASLTQPSRKAQWDALKSYEECVPFVMQNSWTRTEAWYICSARNFKN
jgi:hypothetical protein